MNKKLIFLFLFLIYFIGFLVTSCDCPERGIYNRTYTNLEVKAWDTSGFVISDVGETVNKNSFGLSVSVLSELEQIAVNSIKSKFSGFGFASAFAWSCPDDEYINVDPIDSILITVTDTQTQEIIDVTTNFTAYDYYRGQLTLTELFEELNEWDDGFQFDMTDYSNIPASSIFKVKITLESGTELIEQTQEINFQ